MRKYFDLHLDPEDPSRLQDMIYLAIQLGFSNVATTSLEVELEKKIEVHNRINLEAKSRSDLLEKLRKVRRSHDLVAVVCNNKEVARQAAKDQRVDIINFSNDLNNRKLTWLDHQEAELAETTNCAYEINIEGLLLSGTIRTAKLLSVMRRELQNALTHSLPIIISSGARYPLLQREPRALTSLASLLDIDEELAKDMISEIPSQVLERGKNKKSNSHRGKY